MAHFYLARDAGTRLVQRATGSDSCGNGGRSARWQERSKRISGLSQGALLNFWNRVVAVEEGLHGFGECVVAVARHHVARTRYIDELGVGRGVRSQYSSALILLSFSALPFTSIHG